LMFFILLSVTVIFLVFLLLAVTFIVGITIQGKMTGGMTRTQAWKELLKEVFL
jgi:uncharacterized membrane protein